MKNLFLILCCLMGSVQKIHTMGGAICGIIAPTLIGSCYVVNGPGPVKKRIKDWAILTLGNAVMGGMTELTYNAVITKSSATATFLTASTLFALSCGVTIIWVLEKTVPKARKFSNSKHQLHPIEDVLPSYRK
jgi:hypothetical protein